MRNGKIMFFMMAKHKLLEVIEKLNKEEYISA